MIAREGKAVLPEILEKTKGKSELERIRAYQVLRKLDINTPEVQTAYLDGLRNAKTSWKKGAVEILCCEGLKRTGDSAIKPLVELAQANVEGPLGGRAIWALGKQGENAVPGLTSLFKDMKGKNKGNISRTILEIGTKAVPALAAALKNENLDIVLGSVRVLEKMKGEAKASIPSLIDALKIENTAVRNAVVLALGSMGKEAKSAVGPLVQAYGIGFESWQVRNSFHKKIKDALRRIGKPTKECLPMVIDGIKSENSKVSSAAFEVVAGMGENAEGAVPVVIEMLKNKDKKGYAVKALKLLGPVAKKAGTTLLEMLTDTKKWDSFRMRSDIVSALLKVDPGNKKFFDFAFDRIKEGRAYEYKEAMKVMVPLQKGELPRFFSLLENRSHQTKMLAIDVLARAHFKPEKLVPELTKLLGDKDYSVCVSAAKGLVEMGEKGVKPLNDALRSGDRKKQSPIISAMGEMGPKARAMVPALAEIVKGKDASLSKYAAKAIKKIEK